MNAAIKVGVRPKGAFVWIQTDATGHGLGAGRAIRLWKKGHTDEALGSVPQAWVDARAAEVEAPHIESGMEEIQAQTYPEARPRIWLRRLARKVTNDPGISRPDLATWLATKIPDIFDAGKVIGDLVRRRRRNGPVTWPQFKDWLRTRLADGRI